MMNTNDANSVLAYFRRLVERSAAPTAEVVARELCELVGAAMIGVSAPGAIHPELTSAAPADQIKHPWQTDQALLERLLTSLTVESYANPSGNWLICAVHSNHSDELLFAWAKRDGKRGFTDDEQCQWVTASHALVRWLSQRSGECPDVTAAQRRLERAATITSKLAHDFGNFLTGILGFTELSLSQTEADSPALKFMQEVLHSAHQGAAWIRRLQNFCRRGGASTWPTHLATVLKMEVDRQRIGDGGHLHWESRLPADLPLLEIDAEALQSALQEVINNAREAIKNRGTITVQARSVNLTASDCAAMLGALHPGPYVEISVTDDGPGIAPADRAKLFHDMFYSTKPRARGVGLLVVHGIMQRFKGGFKVEPGPTGKGVCARLYVPATAVDGAALTVNGKAPHILVVHANPLVFDPLQVILESRGCRVTTTDAPQAALSVFTAPKASFALVIVDVAMPTVSGFDFARRILDHDDEAKLLFVHSQSSFPNTLEEDLLKHFDMLRRPLQVPTVLRSVEATLARTVV